MLGWRIAAGSVLLVILQAAGNMSSEGDTFSARGIHPFFYSTRDAPDAAADHPRGVGSREVEGSPRARGVSDAALL